MEKFEAPIDTSEPRVNAKIEKIKLIEKRILSKDQWRADLDESVEAAQLTDPPAPLSIILVDIDNLKDVNDTYGHLMGDDVINDLQYSMLLITESLRFGSDPDDLLRKRDVVGYTRAKPINELSPEALQRGGIPMSGGRVGGDEFAIACLADEALARTIANRISENFYVRLSKPLIDMGVDVAIGRSTLRSGMTVTDLLEEADKNLYVDKMSHLPDIADEEFEELRQLLEKIRARPRDVPKYFKKRGIVFELPPASQ
jgi:GGDEF domain-containing protein